MKGTLKLVAWMLLLLGGAVGTAHAQCQDSHDGMKTKPCWEVNLLWSLRDTGMVEKDVQEEWQIIDQQYGTLMPVPEKFIPGCTTRAAAMRKAVDAAKSGFDELAFRIARACQHHNKEAMDTIAGAGATTIGNYLRKQ